MLSATVATSPQPKYLTRKCLVIFLCGFAGIVSSALLIPQLLTLSGQPLPVSVFWMQVISVLQSSVLLLLMVTLGAVFSKRVNLTTPILDYWIAGVSQRPKFAVILPAALLAGVVGGLGILGFSQVMADSLPSDFLQAGERFAPPWYTRLLYGGITEEVLVRWGLMSFFTWCSYKVFQSRAQTIHPYHYMVGIVLAALLFGLAHLPVALMLTEHTNFSLYLYIIVGNGLFGCIAGWLFYKYGLECAIFAHMIAHITMLVLG